MVIRQTVTVRMLAKSYHKIRRIFPADKDESLANYFHRLSEKLEYIAKRSDLRDKFLEYLRE